MDWSALPGDLLCLVAGRLHDPVDFLRLRAVCRSWRSAAASPPRFLPWLLVRAAHPTTRHSLSFFSLSSGAVRAVPAPSATHRLGHTHSHLLFSDHLHHPNPLLLVNPLTGAQLPLPPAPFHPSSPITQGYYISGPDSPVVLYNARKLCFHHPGGESRNPGGGWTEVPVTDLVAENMFHSGQMFVSNDRAHITIFDATTLAVVGAVRPPPLATLRRASFKCSAFVPSGHELLCVIRYFGRDERGELLEDCGGLEVHRLVIEEEDEKVSPRWVRTRSIGNRMLFVGLYQGFSFNAADFTGFKGNCIYFFKLERARRFYIYRFSMEDGHTEELPCPCIHACTWFVPSLF